MKKILFIGLFVSGIAYGQKDSVTVKRDSASIVMSEFLVFLQDKLTVKDYIPVQNYVNAFLRSKEFLKPKNK